MKKLLFVVLLLLFVLPDVSAVKVTYQKYQVYINFKRLKKDTTDLVRVNVFHEKYHVGRITMAKNGGKCEMFTGNNKVLWVDFYDTDKREFIRYSKPGVIDKYHLTTSGFDSTVTYFPGGNISSYDVFSDGSWHGISYDSSGKVVFSYRGASNMPDEDDKLSTAQYEGCEIIAEGMRSIVFRSPKEYVTINISAANSVRRVEIIDVVSKPEKQRTSFIQEWYDTGVQKYFYSLNGNSSITRKFMETGKMTEYTWKLENQ